MLKSLQPSDHIPFVSTERDCDILERFYADSQFVRVALFGGDKTAPRIPQGVARWVDAGIDALDRWPVPAEKHAAFLGAFDGCERIADPAFQKKPESKVVRQFVNSVLGACAPLGPTWLSVPQLPMVGDSGRNRINRELAEAARDWATRNKFTGRLILPAIFTHQSQVNLKTARSPKLTLVGKCCEISGAHGVWVVDSSLMDQDGSRTLEQTRFPSIVSLHRELLDSLPSDVSVIGGPYWGLNLVLWAKGLIRYPAIGLGNQYQYHLPGGRLQAAKSRIALTPLKRWAVVSQNLYSWLTAAIKAIPPADPAYIEFSGVASKFSMLLRGNNREQVAKAYKEWVDSLAAVPLAGRSLAMYQQLSSAYVLGKSLPDLPLDEGTARRPERVAKQLMLVCL